MSMRKTEEVCRAIVYDIGLALDKAKTEGKYFLVYYTIE